MDSSFLPNGCDPQIVICVKQSTVFTFLLYMLLVVSEEMKRGRPNLLLLTKPDVIHQTSVPSSVWYFAAVRHTSSRGSRRGLPLEDSSCFLQEWHHVSFILSQTLSLHMIYPDKCVEPQSHTYWELPSTTRVRLLGSAPGAARTCKQEAT